jgi:hypothetical protein
MRRIEQQGHLADNRARLVKNRHLSVSTKNFDLSFDKDADPARGFALRENNRAISDLLDRKAFTKCQNGAHAFSPISRRAFKNGAAGARKIPAKSVAAEFISQPTLKLPRAERTRLNRR